MTDYVRYYDDVSVGDALPDVVFGPVTTSDVVRFSTSVETFYPLHHDANWVKERGMPAILLAGPFKHALMTESVSTWAGPESFIRENDCTHRAIDYPGTTLTVTGRITKRFVAEGLGHVECEVELTNSDGKQTGSGRLLVVLPQRGHGHVLKIYEAPEELYSWAFEDGSLPGPT
jgi:acyl dehydratase